MLTIRLRPPPRRGREVEKPRAGIMRFAACLRAPSILSGLALGLIGLTGLRTQAIAQPLNAWTNEQCAILMDHAREITREGLPPRQDLIDRPADLDRQIAAEGDMDESAFLRSERDMACDALFASILQDKITGRIAPARGDAAWHLAPAAYDLNALRLRAKTYPDLKTFLAYLSPRDLEYQRMSDALAEIDARAELDGQARGERIALVASLERRRWLPRTWPARYVIVDLPFFDTRLIENGQTIDRWNVIIGARKTPTPSFVATIAAVTLNPTWTPPTQIVRNEILPMLRRNPDIAIALGYRALDDNGSPIDVDWRTSPFPYRVVQSPGPKNALGQIKLEMPNPYAIYLHDTPSRSLFSESVRAFSHGCIRVEEPRRLALALNPNMDKPALDAAIADNASEVIPLATPTPIYILYRTVRIGDDGALQFAKDVYGRDRRLANAIERGGRFQIASRAPQTSECGGTAS